MPICRAAYKRQKDNHLHCLIKTNVDAKFHRRLFYDIIEMMFLFCRCSSKSTNTCLLLLIGVEVPPTARDNIEMRRA